MPPKKRKTLRDEHFDSFVEHVKHPEMKGKTWEELVDAYETLFEVRINVNLAGAWLGEYNKYHSPIGPAVSTASNRAHEAGLIAFYEDRENKYMDRQQLIDAYNAKYGANVNPGTG